MAELKCQDCREVKPSEDFSRSARRQPDKAVRSHRLRHANHDKISDPIQRCRTCVQASEDLVPDLDEALAEEQIREEYEKSAHESSISGMSSHGSTLAYSSTGYAVSDSGSQISSQHGVYIIDGHDSAWDVPRQPPSASPSNAAQSARASGAGSTATSYNRGPSAGGRGGFSNISAYRPSVEDRVREQVARQQQQGERTQGNQQARGTAGRMRDDSDDEEDSDFEL